MLDKKRHHFLQLVIIFGSVTIISLLSAWGYRSNVETSMRMMGQSMGNMMSTMHAEKRVSDLFIQEEQIEMATGMESHHNSQDDSLKTSYFITTAAIVILLPFIVAGSVFLGIVWLK